MSEAPFETWAAEARAAVASARSVVIKLGTQVLTNGKLELDRAYMHDLATVISQAIAGQKRILIVSSGAVGAGLGALGMDKRPSDVASLQASAAAGQPLLMSQWREAFAIRGIPVGQILLGRGDFDSRERFLNIRNCVNRLHDLGAIPIVNENDSVATEEISLGDNDVLAAKVAVAVRAEALVILTNTAGVLDDKGELVRESRDVAALARFVRTSKSGQGRGGITTKLEAARVANESGIPAVIASGRPFGGLGEVLSGARVGTCISAPGPNGGTALRKGARRQWVALGATPAGAIRIDEGARAALVDRKASLLPKGVVSSSGKFEVGDVVQICGPDGAEVARGLSNLASEEVRLVAGKSSSEMSTILGRQVYEEIVHRENLAITLRPF